MTNCMVLCGAVVPVSRGGPLILGLMERQSGHDVTRSSNTSGVGLLLRSVVGVCRSWD